jgi:molecular chaperone GrpE
MLKEQDINPRSSDTPPEGLDAAMDSRREDSPSRQDRDAPGAAGRELSELESAIAERDRALAEKAELLDRFQRAQAEFENFRKRLLREKEEIREYAAMQTIESLLPILDDFERALQTPGLDPDFRKGLELICQRILDVFTRAGMEAVEETGRFDPHVHHAVDREPAKSDEEDQTIREVYRRGYRFKDRLLRPAMVKVAVKEER